jgi:hypothetical protein
LNRILTDAQLGEKMFEGSIFTDLKLLLHWLFSNYQAIT